MLKLIDFLVFVKSCCSINSSWVKTFQFLPIILHSQNSVFCNIAKAVLMMMNFYKNCCRFFLWVRKEIILEMLDNSDIFPRIYAHFSLSDKPAKSCIIQLPQFLFKKVNSSKSRFGLTEFVKTLFLNYILSGFYFRKNNVMIF